MITRVKAIEIVTSTLDFLLYRNFSFIFYFSKPFPGRICGTRKGEDILLSTTASCAGNRTRKKMEKTRDCLVMCATITHYGSLSDDLFLMFWSIVSGHAPIIDFITVIYYLYCTGYQINSKKNRRNNRMTIGILFAWHFRSMRLVG